MLALALVIVVSGCAGEVPAGEADLILTGGRVWFGADAPVAGAEAPTAIAVAGGKVLALGGDEEIEALAGPSTRRIDLEGRRVVPGLIDSHTTLPDERMNHADYWSADPQAPDRFYASKAAVLRDFEFDRVRYKIAGSTYRSTDLTHWLALDTAAIALADAGFPMAEGLPRERTGVVETPASRPWNGEGNGSRQQVPG